MLKKLLAACTLFAAALPASAAVVGHLNSGSQNNAGTNLSHIVTNGLITPSESDTYLTLSNAAFNALTPAQLAAAYDVLVMPWYVNTDANFDWNTRLLPYLAAGGSILWENPDDLSEIQGAANSGVSITASNSYGPGVGPSGTISLAAPFGDLGAEGFFHIHFSITGFDRSWNCWSVDINGDCHGVNKEFAGGGRMVIGVSDNLLHPNFNLATDSDHRQLTINQLNWLLTGTITGTPPGVPEPGTLGLLMLGLGGLFASRYGRKARS